MLRMVQASSRVELFGKGSIEDCFIKDLDSVEPSDYWANGEDENAERQISNDRFD